MTMKDRYSHLIQEDVSSISRSSGRASQDSSLSSSCDVSIEYALLEATKLPQLMSSSNIEDEQALNFARQGRPSCSDTERRELENASWTSSLQREKDNVTDDFRILGSSWRSEDSEVLALWEEKLEHTGKAIPTTLECRKSPVFQPSRRESVKSVVKRIESLSHAMANSKEKLRTSWARSSPVHSKAGASPGSPRHSVDKKVGGQSPWQDFTIDTSPPGKTSESILHNSPKARYRYGSPCRRMDSSVESSPNPSSAPKQFHHAVSCEIRLGSSIAAAPADSSLRRLAEERQGVSPWKRSNLENGLHDTGNGFESPLVRPMILPGSRPNRETYSKRAGITGASVSAPYASQLNSMRFASSNPPKLDDSDDPPRTIAAAAERALSRQCTKLSLEASDRALSRQTTKMSADATERALSRQSTIIRLEAVSLSMERSLERTLERCSSQLTDEGMVNEYATESGGQHARAGTPISQEPGERKASHRYYQRVTSRERSSRWSSFDGNQLHEIDFIAPSAARFLEDEGCVSPATSPIKRQGTVPFKWEEEPGKPKGFSESASTKFHSALQLPPRLASLHLKQYSQSSPVPLRDRYMNISMSAPLAELYANPIPESSSSEVQHMAVNLPKPQISRVVTTLNSCSTLSERGSGLGAAVESVMTKSRSVGEVRSALQNLSRFSVGTGDGDRGVALKSRAANAPPAPQQTPASKARPTSPRSILCGPDDESRPSSNLSLSSEPDIPRISPPVVICLSQCSSPSPASFDSLEPSIEHDSLISTLESSLTSSLRANTRCNSMTFQVFDLSLMSGPERQDGSAQNVNAFVKFCKSGKRWVKNKTRPNRHRTTRDEQRASPISDFSARLGGESQHGLEVSTTGRNDTVTECRFAPTSSTLPVDYLGNRSPAYTATLELLSPVHGIPSRKSTLRRKRAARTTQKPTRRTRLRVPIQARFTVPIRRALRRFFSRFTFRRQTVKLKTAAESKLLHHVDYTMSPADFRFCKPN